MKKVNILVTGACGHLGRNLITKLLENNNFNLVGLDIVTNESILKSIKYIKTNLDNIPLLSEALNGIDLISWNDQNKITEFKVLIRPLKAVNILHEMMGLMLKKLQE